MLYVDVSQLHCFLKAGRSVTGIQRLVLNSFASLHREFGDGGVRALVFDFTRNSFVSCSLPKFFYDVQAGDVAGQSLNAFSSTAFRSCDQVLFMEWFWNDHAAEASFERARFNGAKIFRFIHDVIPAARPDLFRKSFVKKFVSNAKRAIEGADVVLTNSEHSKADIGRHFSACFVSGKPISVLRLPHEFIAMHEHAGSSADGHAPAKRTSCLGEADTEVIRALGRKKFALMVGTLEERKNTLQVIKAWQKLSSRHGSEMPDLVLVGNYSGHKILFTVAMCMNIAFTKSVIHLPRCNDSTLKWLYQNCLFSIYFSSYEGWGLPVGESLWFGKPVLAQPVSSMPEVGGTLADYVSAGQFDGMLTAIENLCFDAQYLNIRQNQIQHAKLRKWQDFSTELVAVLNG